MSGECDKCGEHAMDCKEIDDYLVYSSCPMDYFEGYVHVSDISEHLERYIIENPRGDETFSGMWGIILRKLYWAWTKCTYIDLKLRQPDFWIRRIGNDYPLDDIAVIFKADNNGTIYAIMKNTCITDKLMEHMYHEFQGDWTLEKPPQHN